MELIRSQYLSKTLKSLSFLLTLNCISFPSWHLILISILLSCNTPCVSEDQSKGFVFLSLSGGVFGGEGGSVDMLMLVISAI